MRTIYMTEERQPRGCGSHHHPGHRHGGPHHHHTVGRGGAPNAPWGRGFGPRGGRRAGRGDIRAAIIVLLGEGPMHGYQLMGEISDRSDGASRPSPGSVYPTLQQLADEGLVSSSESDGRRVYSLTEAGRTQAAALEGRLPWETAGSSANDPHHVLREVGFGVIAAVRQVAQTGTSEQLAAAQEILRDARRGLYRLLAEEQ